MCETKNSQGEDWIRFPNGAEIHFCGLSDPVRWFSSEIGAVYFDEAQEMSEHFVYRLITRVRQRCENCIADSLPDCDHLPHTASLSFNPDNPGHFLHRWFIGKVSRTVNDSRTQFGFRKEQLHPQDENEEISEDPLGDAEFFFAKATDNPYLSEKYLRTLKGLPPADRKRYLEGLWEFSKGKSFFSAEALEDYQRRAMEIQPLFNGRTQGSVEADSEWRRRTGTERPKDPVKLVGGGGPLAVYKRPVKEGYDGAGDPVKAHRYIMGIDVSSGGSRDYSAIIVLDVEDWAVAARFQGKVTPTDLAVEAYRLGRVYNNALSVPEITGGWGFTVEQELKRFHYPNPFTRKVLDRLSRKWTDRTGWDTTMKTRAHMLDTLNRVLEEGELEMHDLAIVNELATFVRGDNGKPEAQPGCNDDLCMALAIAVTVASDQPRTITRLKPQQYRPAVSGVTGY